MQRKQQVGECWVCVIFFAKLDPSVCTLIWEGGLPPSEGGGPPPIFWHFFASIFLVVFRHMVFVDGFLILVKELGLLTNLGQWIRGFGCRGILYIYCIVNNEDDE
jgi:hypothetical protein